jgi:hypothetical protein
MASGNYNSLLDDISKGNIVANADTFHLLLVRSTYTFDKAAHHKRSDITGEVTGTGYSAGGSAITITPALDDGNNWETWTLGSVNWPTCTLDNPARAGVVCKWRGGAASADELLFYVDFGSDKACSGGTFTFTPSGAFKITN